MDYYEYYPNQRAATTAFLFDIGYEAALTAAPIDLSESQPDPFVLGYAEAQNDMQFRGES